MTSGSGQPPLARSLALERFVKVFLERPSMLGEYGAREFTGRPGDMVHQKGALSGVERLPAGLGDHLQVSGHGLKIALLPLAP